MRTNGPKETERDRKYEGVIVSFCIFAQDLFKIYLHNYDKDTFTSSNIPSKETCTKSSTLDCLIYLHLVINDK